MDINLAIGVFDSGMGGLTVLKALKKELPAESFIYLGDTARLPYGTKSPATIQQYALQMTRILLRYKIKALVIACNTATTAALSYLQIAFPHLPILGVVQPGSKAAIKATHNQQIVVLATETTIASAAYQNLILATYPKAKIYARACSLLVALAEEGLPNHHITQETLLYYLQGMKEEDTILLGCTHFPVFKPLLQHLLPSHINIIDSAEATAQELKKLLQEKNLQQKTPASVSITYLVTDSIQRFAHLGAIFLGEPLHIANIFLIDPTEN